MPTVERQLVWSPQAEADLYGIWEFLAREGTLDAADRRLRDIDRTAQLLRRSPYAGRQREELAPQLRSFSVPPHVVFYRIGPTTIEIVRVVDARRNLDAIFPPAPR
jgi:toxin ParE1/3/4